MATISLRTTITMDDEQIRRYAAARGLAHRAPLGYVAPLGRRVDAGA